MTSDARGLGLIEVLMVSALLSVVALTTAGVVNNVVNTNNVAASRAQNSALADALRTQLARRSTCLASLVPPPGPYGPSAEVAVNLGTTRVAAGTELPDYRLTVTSLVVRNIQMFGTTNAGNQVYLADLTVKTQGRPFDARAAYGFREMLASRLLFEVRPDYSLVSCYATDPNTDPVAQLTQLCDAVASIEGVGGRWINGRCRVPDASGPTKCAQLGGQWTGSRCAITPNIFVVSRTVGYGAAGDTWYGALCPTGSSVTGVACYAQGGPLPPVNTMLSGNGGYCWWQSGNESTQFVVQASCSP